MQRRQFHALAVAAIGAAGIAPVAALAGQRYNIVGTTQVMDQGRGEIRVKPGFEEVDALEISVSDGPVTVTKVLVHFADKGIAPWAKAIRPRKDTEWTSDPIKWPSGKTRRVTRVEFWFTGTTGLKSRVDLLGLQ
jgi:hypothetical protein